MRASKKYFRVSASDRPTPVFQRREPEALPAGSSTRPSEAFRATTGLRVTHGADFPVRRQADLDADLTAITATHGSLGQDLSNSLYAV
ncbi:hypothetical protein GCM10009525_06330 [Streptosporangium amethystogenes subsp. fukuiense]